MSTSSEEDFTIKQIVKRIKETDLIPSLEILKSCIDEYMKTLEKEGVKNLAGLRKLLKNKAKLAGIAEKTSLDEQMLILLRREIEGWIPKPVKLVEFTWIDTKILEALEEEGIYTSHDFLNSLSIKDTKKALLKKTGIDEKKVKDLENLCALMNIRWISPNFARIIHELGFTPESLCSADAQKLTLQIDAYNKEKGYYKGKVGGRDIKRLIFESAWQS